MNALAPVRTAAPAVPLLSLDEWRAQVSAEDDGFDELLAGFAAAAEAQLDGYGGVLGQALVTQAWSQSFDRFPCGRELRLPLGPLQAGAALSYYDPAGQSQAFTAFHAVSDAIGPLIVIEDGASWPQTATRPDAVTVTWSCGFGGAAEDVPADIRLAAKMLVGHWFLNREAVNVGNITSELPFGVACLLAKHRRTGL